MIRAHLLQRLHRTAQQQQFMAQLVDALDVGLVALAGEHLLLERVGLGLEPVQTREVVSTMKSMIE